MIASTAHAANAAGNARAPMQARGTEIMAQRLGHTDEVLNTVNNTAHNAASCRLYCQWLSGRVSVLSPYGGKRGLVRWRTELKKST